MANTSHLFLNREKIEKSLRNKFVYLFLDYDGTLAPIAMTPHKAIMPKKTKELLRQLSKMPNCKVAIVSGRALKDISKRVGLKNIVYVGNHGFEIKGPKINFKSPLPVRYRKNLDQIKGKLKRSLGLIKGVFIEDKGFSLSIHYRLVDKKDIVTVKNEFYATLFLYEFRENVQIKAGKMVLEIRPPIPWDKGKVVMWLLGRRLFVMRDKKIKILPIYIGDDTTDEDAFESLRDRGITALVGKPIKTKAHFYLKDTKEVARFLEVVLENIKADAHGGKRNKKS